MRLLEGIKDILKIICDPNTNKEGRIYLKEYDLKYDKGRVIYSAKEQKCFYEILW